MTQRPLLPLFAGGRSAVWLPAAGVFAGWLLVCCRDGGEPGRSVRSGGGKGVPHFTVRGRWHDPSRLRVHIDETGSPLAPGVLTASVREAMGAWNATGWVGFEEADDAEPYDVVCVWRRGSHGDACPSFGRDTSVAHAGPVSAPTFVHFDSGRAWSASGASGVPLTNVAVHELGHVLGLGHSLDEAAVMHTDHAVRPTELGPSDLAGIASLYGRLPPAPSDLWVRRADGENEPLLFRIAPPDRTGVALWDVTGSGRDDLLLWRTDSEGFGRLMIYHFDAQARLTGSTGPMLDSVVPGTRVVFGHEEDGTAVLVSIRENARYSAKRFERGRSLPLPVPPGPLVLTQGVADDDGDGFLDRLPPGADGDFEVLSGDLNGDGRGDAVLRIP